MTIRLERRQPEATTDRSPADLGGSWTIDPATSTVSVAWRALRLWTVTGRWHCLGVIHLDALPPVGVIRFRQPSGLRFLTLASALAGLARRVELHQWPGTFHGSQAILSAEISQRQIAELAAALRRALEERSSTMRSTITIIQMAVRVLGVIQLALGLLFWTGNATGLVGLHILNGIVIVLLLWVMAVLAARAGVEGRLVAVAAVWGLLVPVLGLTQQDLLPGSAHVVIEVLHLLVGLVALDLANTLATRAKARLAPVA